MTAGGGGGRSPCLDGDKKQTVALRLTPVSGSPEVQTDALAAVTEAMADAVPGVDADLEHDRWQPGIGPFEEPRQLAALVDALPDEEGYRVEREVPYPDSGGRCDLAVHAGGVRVPVEAKLLRFRRDDGGIDPTQYATVFSPFPEGDSASLLTDARALEGAAFDLPGGLLGLYYQTANEPYDAMDADALAEKLVRDAEYWFDLDLRVCRVAEFDGLRHPHHQRGAVVTWELVG